MYTDFVINLYQILPCVNYLCTRQSQTSEGEFHIIISLLIWQASEASETLYWGNKLKIGDICLFVQYMCLDVRMSFLYFYPGDLVLVR